MACYFCLNAVCVALLAAGLAALAFLPPLEPAVVVGSPERTNLQTEETGPLDEPGYTRRTVEFPCVDAICEAWLYMPKGAEQPPVVVMAHGMGGQKDFALHNYASKFASTGMAVFVFDYRGWGGSSGSPRHWLSAKRHMTDWRAAIRHIRENMADIVDTSRLCLWGTSFAGGHVLIVASEPEFATHISAVVAQVPNLDATVSTKTSLKQRGVAKSLRMLAAGLVDLLRTTFGQEPLYLPLAGLHGGMGFMQMTPGEFERYKANKPKKPQGGWKNLARAAYAAEHAFFKTSPIKHVHKIKAPVLYAGANKDTMCPMEVIHRAVTLTPQAELYAADCDHFELFTPEYMHGLQVKQVEFLLKHVGVDASDAAARAEHVPEASTGHEAEEGEEIAMS